MLIFIFCFIGDWLKHWVLKTQIKVISSVQFILIHWSEMLGKNKIILWHFRGFSVEYNPIIIGRFTVFDRHVSSSSAWPKSINLSTNISVFLRSRILFFFLWSHYCMSNIYMDMSGVKINQYWTIPGFHRALQGLQYLENGFFVVVGALYVQIWTGI